ncbi:hypothetical protein [Nocardioides iriomotensis]|uniref:Uncharacterized protein n=1 Tax=Nocardioides iriomotensis TaxID=715784 RepID=A0A4Q5J0L1_9ACTN|nr:hypothetical protein [Nocardioides iriomotensis]RYU12022.1 hypothetical protein ETU37_12270 [Nocardioides iriomotensis]
MTTAREDARAVADAVLYEGYVLYPYRAGAAKNQVRWQWGVLMPHDVVALDGSERAATRTDLVVDGDATALRATVRFLQVQRRGVEDAAGSPVDRLDVGDTRYVPWDEAVEREVPLDLPLDEDLAVTVPVEGGTEAEQVPGGRLVRVREPLAVRVTTRVHRPVSPYAVTLLRIEVENATASGDVGARRPDWLRRALVACHVLVEVEGASFVSQLDPPQWASGFVAGCLNDGVFPVLAGPDDQAAVVLSSPIILYDHPRLAPQSETAFFDALEIDELLSLRTATLSDDEKREVRGTDPRTAALLREVEGMPPDLWERLHGTVRYVDAMTTSLAPPPEPPAALDVPWWDPGADAQADPDHDTVEIGGTTVRRGSRVILRPGPRRADAYDLFLAGREATVAAVLRDVDGHEHLAVSVDDDPGAELKAAHGRYLYFAPDEVEPLTRAGA